MRHRRDLWVVSCSCDWSEETVSRFSALMALRRHQEMQGRPDFHDRVRQGQGRLPSPRCLGEFIKAGGE